MCNGNGTAVFDLLFKQRYYTSVGAQNVSKAHSNVLGTASLVVGLDYHFTNTLCCAHNIGGIYRFIGGDKHKTTDTEFVGGTHGIESTENVILYRLVRAVLHEGNVLMSRRMINYIGTKLIKDAFKPFHVSHRAYKTNKVKVGIFSL